LKNFQAGLQLSQDSMTAELTNQVTAGLLLLTLGIVLAIFVLLVWLVVKYVKRTRSSSSSIEVETLVEEKPESDPRPAYRPAAFDAPCRWAAIKTFNSEAVQSVLGLLNPAPCSWSDGVARLADHTLFISPPIQGWTLVIGHGLPDPSEDVDECFRFILRLSRALGHVQFFSANRAVNHHAWVRADAGQILRAYAWAGEALWNQGKITQAEKDLDLRCFSYGESPAAIALSGNDSHNANAEKVNFLAARWSIDPTAIAEGMLPARQGISGEMIHSRQH
jgi:hypothetical protein